MLTGILVPTGGRVIVRGLRSAAVDRRPERVGGFLENLAGEREFLKKVLAHARGLRALAGKNKGKGGHGSARDQVLASLVSITARPL